METPQLLQYYTIDVMSTKTTKNRGKEGKMEHVGSYVLAYDRDKEVQNMNQEQELRQSFS